MINEIPSTELAGIKGGNMLIDAYAALLKKIEDNPQDYTFLMDWYYQ